jgi:hypothetical protein
MFKKVNNATRRRIVAAFAAALLLGGGLAVSAEAWTNRVRVNIVNNSDYDIYQLHMSSIGDNNWGSDLLGAKVLYSGSSVAVTMSPGRYDLKLVDEDGDTCTVLDIGVYRDDSWSITNRWLLSCEFH